MNGVGRISTLGYAGLGAAMLLVSGVGSIALRAQLSPHPSPPACQVPEGIVTDWRALGCHEETKLQYPTSRLLVVSGEKEKDAFSDGDLDAYYATDWGEEDGTPDTVLAWYSSQLAALGWTRARQYDMPNGSTRSWTRGKREIFTVIIDGYDNYITQKYGVNGFVYRVAYSIKAFDPAGKYTEPT